MNVHRQRLLFWILPLFIAIVSLGLSRLAPLETLELRLLDARFCLRGPLEISNSPIQIVAIDDQSFSVLNQKWPLGGSIYARAIRNLNRAGADLIVFDIEFTEANSLYPGEDSTFAEAIAEAGNVILAGKLAYTYGLHQQIPTVRPVPPNQVLLNTGASWGIANEIPDSDGFTRRYITQLQSGESTYNSLVLEALRNVGESSENHQEDFDILLHDDSSFLINYYGPPGTFPAISLASVLDDSDFDLGEEYDTNYMDYVTSDLKSGVNPFLDKIVLIGAAAEELQDTKNTPFLNYGTTPQKMPGVEMHANALQTVIDGSFLRRITAFSAVIMCLMLAYLMFYVSKRIKPLGSILALLVTTVVVFSIVHLAFIYFNLWVDLIAPVNTIFLTSIFAAVFGYWLERSEKFRISEMFSKYLPKRVVKELIAKPELLKLGGERRNLTILFADLEGFTALTQKLDPEVLVEMINEYMTVMTEAISAHGGIIDKYEGDLVMAEFGVPVSSEDHHEHACRAALEMRSQLENLHIRWHALDLPNPPMRIGINSGEVIVGNMGSQDLFDYTVIGDAVNICAKLEKANKLYGTIILISNETHNGLPDGFVTRRLKDLILKGRQQVVEVYELIAADADALNKDQKFLLDHYQSGWSYFTDGEYMQAAICFETALQVKPDDIPSEMMLNACHQSDDSVINPHIKSILPENS
ncbi:hypothetical protein CEE37_04080 [candidate division LCP-89 bacterium B3_LCP]|uniref:Guanylate cyclase domain-containing protein n=1 Tax=candidate division LCP-89 bacterium B3_LCP TaxID=2012998 RepID=A0A532V3I7_UNCL8|nr:MAG: hypothetical protein CEE37_04080 [candidate division LCP-89 bacterium B3_LCP]